MNPIIEKVAERADLDELIVKAVSSGATKRAVAKQFAITPAQVDLAIGRIERRKKREASPYLSHKFPVRMANALYDRGVNGEDNAAVLKFIFNEPEALRYPMLGRKTLKESQAIAREWLKDKPELQAQFTSANLIEEVALIILDEVKKTEHDLFGCARAAIRATLEHYAENVSEGMQDAGACSLEHPTVRMGGPSIHIMRNAKRAMGAMLKQALAELDA